MSDDLAEIFGPPPLLDGENLEAYQSLKSHLYNAVKPSDILEQMWVYDVLNLMWETVRLRRLRAKLLKASAPDGLERVIRPIAPNFEKRIQLIHEWASGDSEAIEVANELFKLGGHDQSSIDAQALAINLKIFTAIDAMIANADARRLVILRELDRHRDVVARRLKEVIENVTEEAGFANIAPSQEPCV